MFLYEWFGSSRAAHLVQDVMPCVEVLTCGVLCCFVLFCLVLFVPQGQGKSGNVKVFHRISFRR
jgi:hypothetical protein